jgi:hypothetical protein
VRRGEWLPILDNRQARNANGSALKPLKDDFRSVFVAAIIKLNLGSKNDSVVRPVIITHDLITVLARVLQKILESGLSKRKELKIPIS